MLGVRALDCVRGERLVFAGLDFAMAPGEALIVQGPNGAGKSSLLRLLAGLLPPAGGEILWRGKALRKDLGAFHAELCFVGHLDGLKPVFSVAENLAFWAAMAGAEVNGAVATALARLGLSAIAAAPVRQLSAGQKRRLNLARLALRPHALWLLDEPTTGLDRESAAIFVALAHEHLAAGGVMVAASHVDLGLSGAQLLHLGSGGAA